MNVASDRVRVRNREATVLCSRKERSRTSERKKEKRHIERQEKSQELGDSRLSTPNPSPTPRIIDIDCIGFRLSNMT